jgi:hypothetical protein
VGKVIERVRQRQKDQIERAWTLRRFQLMQEQHERERMIWSSHGETIMPSEEPAGERQGVIGGLLRFLGIL